jgi:hypothetical protein
LVQASDVSRTPPLTVISGNQAGVHLISSPSDAKQASQNSPSGSYLDRSGSGADDTVLRLELGGWFGSLGWRGGDEGSSSGGFVKALVQGPDPFQYFLPRAKQGWQDAQLAQGSAADQTLLKLTAPFAQTSNSNKEEKNINNKNDNNNNNNNINNIMVSHISSSSSSNNRMLEKTNIDIGYDLSHWQVRLETSASAESPTRTGYVGLCGARLVLGSPGGIKLRKGARGTRGVWACHRACLEVQGSWSDDDSSNDSNEGNNGNSVFLADPDRDLAPMFVTLAGESDPQGQRQLLGLKQLPLRVDGGQAFSPLCLGNTTASPTTTSNDDSDSGSDTEEVAAEEKPLCVQLVSGGGSVLSRYGSNLPASGERLFKLDGCDGVWLSATASVEVRVYIYRHAVFTYHACIHLIPIYIYTYILYSSSS